MKGKSADLWTCTRRFIRELGARFRRILETGYQRFIERVAGAPKNDRDEVDTLSQRTAALVAGHSERVACFAVEVYGEWAKKRSLSAGEVEIQKEKLRPAALLHDIGKIGISREILEKAEPLTPEEREALKKHTQMGAEILRYVSALAKAAEVALGHHEHWDGTGYPEGRKGEEIPLFARIVAVAEVYDALSVELPWRSPSQEDEIVEYIRQRSGTQFDPDVVEAFLSSLPKLRKKRLIELAIEMLAHGLSPEEMQFQHPHLSLAQIHAAQAYYHDHQAELDSEIERRLRSADDIAARYRDSPLRGKLLKLRGRR